MVEASGAPVQSADANVGQQTGNNNQQQISDNGLVEEQVQQSESKDLGSAGLPNAAPTQVTLDENTSIKGKFEFGKDIPDAKGPSEIESSFLDLIPDEYKEDKVLRTIAKKDDPVGELVKQWGEAQKLLGRKSVNLAYPGENATPEERKEYFRSIGVPETIEGYKIESGPWSDEDKSIGEKIESTRDDRMMKTMRESALELGLTPKQFSNLVHKFEAHSLQRAKENVAKQQSEWEKYDREFGNKMSAEFGDGLEGVKKVGRGFISEFLNQEQKEVMKRMPNEQAVVMAVLLRKIHDRYVRQDGFGGREDLGSNGQLSQKEVFELMSSEAYMNFQHPLHEETRKKIDAHFGTNRNRK